ncbi:MAG: cellulase family glycosylhydrolase [Muribaculum sp.]|nr:cellulase family glycosylhydrolase [Muribaculum sp.]
MLRKKCGLLLAVWLVIGSMAGCGSGTGEDSQESVSGQEVTTGQESTEESTGTSEEATVVSEESAGEESTEPTEQSTDVPESELHHPTAQEILDDIVIGWNLGNSLDSNTKENEGLASEIAWGNPVTTKEMIDMVKETGINMVRVPVTWYNHMDSESYEIDKDWMDRVEEVVGYVLDNDMYCIVNVHHDTGENGWLRASRTNLEENKKKYAAIWEQICERFGGYGEKLLFEGFNELLDDQNNWYSPGAEAIEVTNELNQLFVDTVRASGQNNATRCLIVNTYCAGGNREVTNGFVLPTDTISSKLIVEAHIYQPFYFVSGTSQTATSWASDKGSLDSYLKNMDTTFKQKGIPVLIGEFGCVSSRSDLERQTWLQYYVDACYNYGFKCIWWDNGTEYKVINRKNMKIAEPELLDIMLTEAKGGTYVVDTEKLSQEPENENLCANEDNWSIFINTANGAVGTVDYVDNGIQLTVSNSGKNTWDLQISYIQLTLEQDTSYKISFDYSCSPKQNMSFHVMQNYEDYQSYSSESLRYKEEAQHYEGEFRMTEKTDSNARITFDCGGSKLDGTYTVTIENLTLTKVQ